MTALFFVIYGASDHENGSNILSGTTSASTSTATGAFHVTNGQIIAPDGQPFVAAGVDVIEGDQPSPSTLLNDFPGINFVRLAIYDFASPATLSAYVNELTSAGIVVELEDHRNSDGSNAGGSSGTIFTGQQLTTELNWYSSIASAFANNPNVWFGTNNEPSEIDASGNQNPAALSTWQQQTYDAIRGAGNNNPVMVEINGGNTPSSFAQGYTPSVYAGMTDIVGDVHYYGWVTGYSTDQATVSGNLAADIAQTQQTITSADGTLPIIIGEYGNSTSGTSIDPNANQVIAAVQQSGYGNVAWSWGQGNPGDGLTGSDGSSLTQYGQQIAAGIAAGAAAAPVAPVTPPTAVSTPAATPSANGTMVLAGSAGAIVDASGNTWTLTADGQVAVNGVADTTTANVTELAYVNNDVWQENASYLWWGKASPTDSWAPQAGTGSSPLPAAIVLSADAAGNTVSQSEVSIVATSGDNILFLSGSGDIVNLSGGINTITDTGQGNTFILPVAGNGTDIFTSNILASGDALDLTTALAATDWNGASSTLANYLTLADSATGAVLLIAPTSGGTGVAIATIEGAANATLSGWLDHLIT